MSDADELLLTPAEAAKRLHVAPVTLRVWSEKGLVRTLTTAGGHRRYPLSEVERLLQGGSRAGVERPRILIVDDDRFTAEVVRDGLLSDGLAKDVEIADDGFDAGLKLRAFRPEIVLLDLMMPGINGFDVCRRIKADPVTAGMRIIAMSGYPSADNVQRILAEGAEVCLSKPVDHQQLVAALRLPPGR